MTYGNVDYLLFQEYPSAPAIHITHEDPSSQGNLPTVVSVTCRNMEDNKAYRQRKKERARV